MEFLFLENVKSVPKLFNESQVELLITFCYSIDFLINKIILNYILLSKIFTVFEEEKSIIRGGKSRSNDRSNENMEFVKFVIVIYLSATTPL
jgi:hypothetical protein